MSITHAKVSAIADGADTDLVRPVDWNADHVTTTKLLSHTRVKDAASGDVAYTGYGFQPSALIVFASDTTRLNWGVADSNLANMGASLDGETPVYSIYTTYLIVISTGANSQTALLKTLDADGFTLTWAKSGAGTSYDITFTVLAFG